MPFSANGLSANGFSENGKTENRKRRTTNNNRTNNDFNNNDFNNNDENILSATRLRILTVMLLIISTNEQVRTTNRLLRKIKQSYVLEQMKALQ